MSESEVLSSSFLSAALVGDSDAAVILQQYFDANY